jgi:hypothetical protein
MRGFFVATCRHDKHLFAMGNADLTRLITWTENPGHTPLSGSQALGLQGEFMGAWGFGSFDNDDAADFMADATESGDLSLVRGALDNVLTSTEYVEAPDASQAIAAAEIVAAALGRPTPAAQREEELTSWIARIRPTIDSELAAQARDALTRILAPNSELRELWEEAEEFPEWQSAVSELGQHLQA